MLQNLLQMGMRSRKRMLGSKSVARIANDVQFGLGLIGPFKNGAGIVV